MANAGTVTVDFAAEVAKFNAQLKQVNDRVKSVESGFKSLQKIADTALRFFSVGIATAFIKSAADAADALGKTADKLGISTERLTAFQLAAADAGVEAGTLSRLLTDAQRKLGEAAFGTGQVAKVLSSFGLNIRELQRLSPDELFLRYADAIGTLTRRSDQFAAAQVLFGKTAQEAFTLIEAGRPAIEQAAATVDRLGLALTRVDIKKIEEANDKIGLLGRVSQAVGQQLAAALAPFVSNFVDGITSSGVAADQARTSFENFARGAFISFELIKRGANLFDITVSSAFAAFFTAIEKATGAIAAFQEFEVRTERFLGGPGAEAFARTFEKSAARLREVEAFSAAASEQAAARVVAAQQSLASGGDIIAQADAIIAQAQKRAEEAATKQAEINAALALGGADDTQVEAFNTNLLIREDLLKLHHARMLQLQQTFTEASAKLAKEIDHDQFVRQQTEREAIAIRTEQAILNAKVRATNAAIGLLQALAGRSKAAAIALVAINKGRAIAEAIQNVGVAVTRTLASVPYPYNIAAAAAIKTMGAIEVAMIAATGFAEIQQIRSSPGAGAPLGSPTNPIFTETQAGGIGPAAERPVIQIQVDGLLTTREAATQLAEILKDVIDNSDVRIIGKNSAQAQELRE